MSTRRQHVVVALAVAVAALSAHVTYTQFIRFAICARTASNASLNGLIYCYGSWRCIMSHTLIHTQTVAHMSAHTHVAGNKEMTTKHKAKPIQYNILFSALSHQHTHIHTWRQSVTRVCIRVFRNLITNFAPLILKLYTKLRVSSPAAQAPPPVPASCRPAVLRIGNDHNGLNCQQQQQLPVWLQLWCGCLRPPLSSLCTHATY